jgi:hypothetical protein
MPRAQECHDRNIELPESVQGATLIAYRSIGLGLYGASIRFVGMPLEKIALFMNSAQVSGECQIRQALHLTFQDGKGGRSLLSPYSVVGPASGIAWFLQYSVMGMVFQVVDKGLSESMGLPVMPYGSQLMEDPKNDVEQSTDVLATMKSCSKILLAPAIAGMFESVVANRAEVQRYFGIQKFAEMEKALKWNPISKICGPAYFANSSRNLIMSATSFVITPVLYRKYYPQEQKSQTTLFWAGLGINIFIGNVVAITQQALWGRALDYAAAAPGTAARNIHYKSVIQEGLAKEGFSAFFTLPKFSSRVLMNAPVQGTLPWFYNEMLPLGEDSVLSAANSLHSKLAKRGLDSSSVPLKADNFNDSKMATSPIKE